MFFFFFFFFSKKKNEKKNNNTHKYLKKGGREKKKKKKKKNSSPDECTTCESKKPDYVSSQHSFHRSKHNNERERRMPSVRWLDTNPCFKIIKSQYYF